MVELQMEYQELCSNVGGLAILLVVLDDYWGCDREVGSVHAKLTWSQIVRYVVADAPGIFGVALITCFVISDQVCFH